MKVQHIGSCYAETYKVLGPFDEGHPALLPFVNDPCTQSITPNRETVGIDVPDRQITAMLRDEDERW